MLSSCVGSLCLCKLSCSKTLQDQWTAVRIQMHCTHVDTPMLRHPVGTPRAWACCWYSKALPCSGYANSLGLTLVRQRSGLAVGTPTISMSPWYSKLCWGMLVPQRIHVGVSHFWNPNFIPKSIPKSRPNSYQTPTSAWSTKP